MVISPFIFNQLVLHSYVGNLNWKSLMNVFELLFGKYKYRVNECYYLPHLCDLLCFYANTADLLVGVFIYTILKKCSVPKTTCTYSVMAWLLNPFTFTIGTRGNCEPVVCAIILWIIICLMNGMFSPWNSFFLC